MAVVDGHMSETEFCRVITFLTTTEAQVLLRQPRVGNVVSRHTWVFMLVGSLTDTQ